MVPGAPVEPAARAAGVRAGPCVPLTLGGTLDLSTASRGEPSSPWLRLSPGSARTRLHDEGLEDDGTGTLPPLATGTFAFATPPDDNYGTCQHCALLVGYDKTGQPLRAFYPKNGTLRLDAFDPDSGPSSRGESTPPSSTRSPRNRTFGGDFPETPAITWRAGPSTRAPSTAEAASRRSSAPTRGCRSAPRRRALACRWSATCSAIPPSAARTRCACPSSSIRTPRRAAPRWGPVTRRAPPARTGVAGPAPSAGCSARPRDSAFACRRGRPLSGIPARPATTPPSARRAPSAGVSRASARRRALT